MERSSARGEAFMKDRNLRFYAVAALWLALFALLYLSNRRIDLNVGINKSTGVSVSIEDVVSLSPPEVTAKAYSASDDTYQALSEILQNVDCYKKLRQNARAYSHDYEAHCVTLRYADAQNQNLLLTVYSDGVCQVNGKFCTLRSPSVGADVIYRLLRNAAA